MVNPEDEEYCVHQFKECDGKKLKPTTKVGLDIEDEDEKKTLKELKDLRWSPWAIFLCAMYVFPRFAVSVCWWVGGGCVCGVVVVVVVVVVVCVSVCVCARVCAGCVVWFAVRWCVLVGCGGRVCIGWSVGVCACVHRGGWRLVRTRWPVCGHSRRRVCFPHPGPPLRAVCGDVVASFFPLSPGLPAPPCRRALFVEVWDLLRSSDLCCCSGCASGGWRCVARFRFLV